MYYDLKINKMKNFFLFAIMITIIVIIITYTFESGLSCVD